MEKFSIVRSHAVSLPIQNVDTDMIIPAQFLTSVSRGGYGLNLFKNIRQGDPKCALHLSEASGAEILISDENFGCGSSREHAVWALREAGFRVVIAKSFADIFASNSSKNGLLLVTIEPAIIDRLLQDPISKEIEVNLERQQVTLSDGTVHAFNYDPFRKECLLQGLDDLDYILNRKSKILSFRSSQEPQRFYRTTEGAHGE
ncbi:MAG: 3-isopropylmalate dehydratase small subunit [Bdellovibrionales bacterium]|nr:3-isopropylmalate dehydratase small subunit [Bdellovibrionales bacterium]